MVVVLSMMLASPPNNRPMAIICSYICRSFNSSYIPALQLGQALRLRWDEAERHMEDLEKLHCAWDLVFSERRLHRLHPDLSFRRCHVLFVKDLGEAKGSQCRLFGVK